MFRRCVWLAAVLVILGVSGVVPAARGDGMAFKTRDFSLFHPARQDEQIAVIHQVDGVQHMLIAINVALEDDAAGVWVLPVPGPLEEVHVDLAGGMPALWGTDVVAEARRPLGFLMSCVSATQVYAGCLVFLEPQSFLAAGVSPGVLLGDRAERWGLRTEVVQAESLAALAAHIEAAGHTLSEEQLASFEPYCDEGFVFVVTQLRSLEALFEEFPRLERRSLQGRWPTLSVSFPSATPFYPMRATSGYGDTELRLRLYVTEYVEPVAADPLKRALSCRYYEQRSEKLWRGDIAPDAAFKAFVEKLPAVPFEYTVIAGRTAASDFVSDITFRPHEPAGMAYARFIESRPRWQWGLAWWAITLALSYVAGGVAGVLVVRQWQRPALIGLSNVLTLLALSIVARDFGLVERPSGSPPEWQRDHARYLLVFSIAFIGLAAASYLALVYPLWVRTA
jgi:hypothetical protein